MQPHPRYQVLEQIAVGDFATVFRGKDLELGREVAIKQIHPQFLADQRLLERYWQEAQLLAALEHPNIMTIYDMARDRGWLILELMQGSLADHAAGQPMDLNFLRVALVCALQGLKFLHANGIVHGDVKPTNMLLDKRNWIKLGDFGLAQRVTNDQGSLLKGTTKYMAPERVSDQFGPVGPQSDLYSLGFSMYELMCGDAFETLFPGLGAFGRDKQIAWMMWQAAPDRQLPEIQRILEGVPDDLARVIQKLATKDPKRRYRSAEEAIADLKSGMGYGPQQPSEEQLAAEAVEREAAARKKRRRLLIVAAAVSLILTVAMLLLPKPGGETSSLRLKNVDAVVRHKHPEARTLVLDTKDHYAVKLRPDDRVYVNDEAAKFDDIQVGDHLSVKVHHDPGQQPFQEVRASRPQTSAGTVKSVDPRVRSLIIVVESDNNPAREVEVLVPDAAPLTLNGETTLHGRNVTVADLAPDDRVTVQHKPDAKGRVATTVEAKRIMSVEGIVRGVDKQKNTLTMALGTGSQAPQMTWPISPQCEITINRKRFVGGKAVRPADLRAGDEVAIRHDTHIVSLKATRVLSRDGTFRDAGDGRTVLIELDGEEQPRAMIVDGDTELKLGEETVAPTELQAGDPLHVRYDAADPAHPVALEIKAQRPIDRSRWAILIANGSFDDPRIGPLKSARADAKRLRDVLTKRYRVAPDQAIVIVDADREALGDALREALKQIETNSHLLVHLAGHVYVDPDGVPYYTVKDTEFPRLKESGMSLASLMGLIDSCSADDKLLVLDVCHGQQDAGSSPAPSAEELIAAAKETSEKSVLTSTSALATCQKGQSGRLNTAGQSLVTDALIEAFIGRADSDGDRRASTDELFRFVNNSLRTATDGKQTPALVRPEAAPPPRLSNEAIEAISELADSVLDQKVKPNELKELYLAADEQAPKQPEPQLLYALGLLKAKQFTECLPEFQAVRQQHPDQLLAIEGMVWSLFQRRMYTPGISGLVRFAARLPRDRRGRVVVDGRLAPSLEWTGRLREFATSAVTDDQRPTLTLLAELDETVERAGPAAVAAYTRGRQHVRKVLKEFDDRTAATQDNADKLKISVDRRQLSAYATFSFEAAVQRVLDGMRH